jgi:hypothetical protein
MLTLSKSVTGSRRSPGARALISARIVATHSSAEPLVDGISMKHFTKVSMVRSEPCCRNEEQPRHGTRRMAID